MPDLRAYRGHMVRVFHPERLSQRSCATLQADHLRAPFCPPFRSDTVQYPVDRACGSRPTQDMSHSRPERMSSHSPERT